MAETGEPKRPSRFRLVTLVLAAILFLPPLSLVVQLTGDEDFCGTWCPRMFFVWRQGETWSEFVLGFARSYMGVALVAGMLTSTYLFGRYWCSHLCPIGGILELGSRLVPRFLRIDYSHIPGPAFRYGYFSVYLLAAATGTGSLCCGYCSFATVPRLLSLPFSAASVAFFLRTAGWISLGLVVLLGLLAKGGRANCNLLCPIGALDAIVNAIGAKLGRPRMRIAPSECTQCGKCVPVCPVWAIEDNHGQVTIDQHSCIPCRICESACPTGAIRYEKAVT
jgi:ferredoxin-type protein NapH